MNQVAKQGLIAVVFLGLLGLAAAYGGRGRLAETWNGWRGKSTVDPQSTSNDSLDRYGFRLTEHAKELGLDFRHESPNVDSRLAHIQPIVAAMGAGASVVDFDSDGWHDIYVITSREGGLNRMFRNLRNGKFEEVGDRLGISDLNQAGTGVCMGSTWADYDNDGFPDLCLYKWGRPELFHSIQGERFERVTERANLPAWLNANAACWFDYNRDGNLDLFLAGYWADDVNLWDLKHTRIMPESFEYANNGGRKVLLRNQGDGSFRDVTTEVGIKSTRWTLAVAAADLCGTGYPDLVLANDYGVSEFYANRGGQRFEEVGYQTGIGVAPKSGMNVSFGDVLNQGKLGIYISNITEAGNLVQGNNLWLPTQETAEGLPRYLNQAGELNVERGGWSWGAKFGDLNNDGFLDLYLTNGYISADKKKSYWYDYGKIAGGLKGLISDAKYWPPIGDQSLAGYQSKCVWLNQGGDFVDVAPAVGVADHYDGRAVVLVDLLNRGELDVVVANQNGPLLAYQNQVVTRHDWVQFQLTGGARPGGPTGLSNRGAVGAQVRLFWTSGAGQEEFEQVQVVTSGDGYASQGMLRLHFGLGVDAHVEKAVVQWPSGRTQTLQKPDVRQIHKIEEPTT